MIPFFAQRSIRQRIAGGSIMVLAMSALATAWIGGYFSSEPFAVMSQGRSHPKFAILYVSGDMGLGFGAGALLTPLLQARGWPVLGFKSPTAFATHRTRDDVDRIVSSAVAEALQRFGAERLIIIGQSYGSDVLQTGLARLPSSMRSKISGIILIVPGDAVFFRADPTGFAYRGKPDSIGHVTAASIVWTPLICIYGLRERDSLCPKIRMANAQIVGLPGGHFLNRDGMRVSRTILDAINRLACRPQ